MNYKNQMIRMINLVFVGLQAIFPLFNKKRLGEFLEDEIYYGFIWGSYPKTVVKYCIDYIAKNPKFLKDLKTCKIPEELCFQTILMNSEYADKVTDNNLRFWNMSTGDGSGPGYLSEADLGSMRKSDALFARKVKFNSRIHRYLKEKLNCKNKYV